MYPLNRIIGVSIVGFSFFLQAETVAPPTAPTQQPSNSAIPSSGPSSSNSISVFDNNFFNSRQEGPTSVGAGRYSGSEPDFNTEQDAQWRETCKSEIAKGMKDFRECYQREKKKTLQGLKQGMDDVERKQQLPMNNTPSTVQELKRPPSSFEE